MEVIHSIHSTYYYYEKIYNQESSNSPAWKHKKFARYG